MFLLTLFRQGVYPPREKVNIEQLEQAESMVDILAKSPYYAYIPKWPKFYFWLIFRNFLAVQVWMAYMIYVKLDVIARSGKNLAIFIIKNTLRS